MTEQTTLADLLAALPDADERNRYFTGKFLTERDFADEQAYFLGRHCLHNRLLHGWGIVCGLEVRATGEGRLEIAPGAALDPLGRELILRAPSSFDLAGAAEGPFFLAVRYYCEEVEPVPPLLDGERPDPTEMQANRYRESVELMAVDPGALGGDQWRTPASGFDSGSDASEDCATVVPLAYVETDGGAPEIHLDGRPILTQPAAIASVPEALTTITALSWEHGKPLTVGRSDKGNLALTVTFSGPLRASDQAGTGIDEETFHVQYRDEDGTLRPVPHARGKPPALDRRGRRTATFGFDPTSFVGRTLHVTVKCDFLVDDSNRAVDGSHIGGRLPTGNGMAGGTFESWFRLESGGRTGKRQKTDKE